MSDNQLTTSGEDAFKAQVFDVARKALVAMYGSQQGQKAAARVALAFVAAAKAAKNPNDLYRCSSQSIHACVAYSAETDLYPGGPYPRVWLVPRGGQLQWEINHRGIAVIAQRAGYSIRAVPVHKSDPVLVLAFGEVTEHDADPDLYPSSLTDLRGVYVEIKRLSDGVLMGRPWVPASLIRKRAESAMAGVVWKSWPVEMAQKTAIKWLMARGTLVLDSVELDVALAADPEPRPGSVEVVAETRPVSRPVAPPAAIEKDDDLLADIEAEALAQRQPEAVPVTREEEPPPVVADAPEPGAQQPTPDIDRDRLQSELQKLERRLLVGDLAPIRNDLGMPGPEVGAKALRQHMPALLAYRDRLQRFLAERDAT